jgi:Glycosyl hydrolases family 15
LHGGVKIARAAIACAVVVAVGVALVSGGSGTDPRTPPALPGLPPPFLGTTVSGDGGLTAALDAYGDVVDLRSGPAGAALIDNPSDRQAAGTVPADTGIVPRVRVGNGPELPMWRAERVSQHYLRGTNVVETVAYVEGARMIIRTAAAGNSLATEILPPRSSVKGRAFASISVDVEEGIACTQAERAGQIDLLCRVGRPLPPVAEGGSRDFFRECERVTHAAIEDGRRWLGRSLPLGIGSGDRGRPAGRGGRRSAAGRAPGWARQMYQRSLLTIHALTSRRTGAVAAGARDGWAYVWPRDAATAALALAASGHRAEARHVARFLTGLDLAGAARFDEAGTPIPGRAAQGDATGWVAAAAEATGVPGPRRELPWRNRSDYQESSPGTFLGNALAAAAAHVDGPKTRLYDGFSAHQHKATAAATRIAREFGTGRGLVRSAGEPASGLDSAAAWAIRPFDLRPLYPAAERTLLHLAAHATRFGITPGEGWRGGPDPWTAPTAWSAWSLAALANKGNEAPATAEARRSGGAFSRTGGRGARTNLPVREGEAPSRPSPALPPNSARRDRHAALTLLKELRRASTPTGDLPERVGAHTGIPTSTTPLLWSSAFAVLAIRELWPSAPAGC